MATPIREAVEDDLDAVVAGIPGFGWMRRESSGQAQAAPWRRTQ